MQGSHRALSSRAEAILLGKTKTDEAKTSDETNNMREFDEMSKQMKYHLDHLDEGLDALKRIVLKEKEPCMNASQGHRRQTTKSDGSLKAVYSNQSERGVNDHTVRESKIVQALRDSTNVPTSRHSSDMHKTHRGMRDNEYGESDRQESDEDTHHSSRNIFQSSATSVGPRRTNKGKPSSSNGSTRQAKRR